MTPDEEPLLCRCGDHSAKYVPGNKPHVVTNVTTKEKALKRVRAVCVLRSADTTRAELEVL